MSDSRIGQRGQVSLPPGAAGMGDARAPSLGPAQAPTREGEGEGEADRHGVARSAHDRSRTEGGALAGVNLPRVVGEASVPAVQFDPRSFMGRIQQGHMRVAVPLREGAAIGVASVRPHTQAEVTLAVRDGRLDFARTQIDFRNEDGTDSSLDGPLWIDPDRIYIDADGTIRAEVPCWPDPNITEDVLGQGVQRVPDSPEEFLRLLTREAQNQGRLPLTPNVHVDPHGVTTQPVEVPESHAEPSDLERALNVLGTQVRFEGTLSAGPLRLGDGVLLNLEEGTRITTAGPLDNLRAHLDAPVRSFHVAADGTTLRTGAGRVGVDVHFHPQAGTQGQVEVAVTSFELNDVRVESPAGPRRRHELRLGRLAVSESAGRAPLIQATLADAGSALRVSLPRIDLSNVQGEVQLEGSDGRPASLRLGVQPGSDAAPMSAVGDLDIDTAAGTFRVVTDVENLQAQLSSVSLDSPHFDLRTSDARLEGSGRLTIEGTSAGTRFDVRAADPAHPITATVAVEDAFIGRRGDTTGFSADLAPSSGRIELQHLALTPGEHPVLEGGARLDVTLDGLHFPGGQSLDLNLRPGTHGTLVLQDLAWEEGAASPRMRVALELDADVGLAFDPSSMPGMEGVSARADGRPGLRIEGTLAPDGTLELAGNIQVRGARLQGTRVTGRLRTPPAVDIPTTPLPPIRRFSLPAARPVPALPQGKPNWPALRVQPLSIFQALDAGVANASIALQRLVLRNVAERRVSWRGVSGAVTLDVVRQPGPVALLLSVRDGEIQAGSSSIVLNPPVDLLLNLSGGIGGVTGGTQVDLPAQVSGLRFERTADGRLRLIPQITWQGRTEQVVSALDLDRWLEEQAGDQITQAVFGRATLPSRLSELNELRRAIPALGEAFTFDPDGKSTSTAEPSPLDYVDATRTAFSVSGARLNPNGATVIDLGNNQSIELLPGTHMSVTGSPQSFVVAGRARLGRVRLGNGEVGAALQGGEANVRVSVVRGGPGSEPSIAIQIDDLSTDSLSARGHTGGREGVAANVTVREVRGASITLTTGGGQPTAFRAQVPDSGRRMVVSGRMALADGTAVDLGEASARSVDIGYGSETNVRIRGLEATVSAQLPMPAVGNAHPRLDVRRATLRGDIVAGSGGLDPSTPLQLRDLDASVYGLPLDLGRNFDIRFQQIALGGDYTLRSSADGTWVVETNGAPRANGAMPARAIVDRFRFHITEPDVEVDAPGAQFELNLRRLTFGPGGLGMHIEGGRFDGEARRGSIRTARPDADALVESIRFERGTRVHGDLPRLIVGGPAGVRLDTTIRVEGPYRLGERNVTPRGRRGRPAGVEHHDVGLSGTTRMAIRAVAEGEANMGLNIQAEVNLDGHWAGRTTVEVPDVRVPGGSGTRH